MDDRSKVVISSGESIDVLDIDLRTRNALYRAQIRNVNDLLILLDAGEEYLYAVRNMGVKGVADVKFALDRVKIVHNTHQQVPRPKEILVYADCHGQIAVESPIDVLGLSIRVYNSLRRSRLNTIEELLNFKDTGEDALFRIRNMGEKGVAEVNTALERFESVDSVSILNESTPDKPEVQLVYFISPEVIAWQADLIERQIQAGTLHFDAVFQRHTVGYWLSVAKTEPPYRMFLVYSTILGETLTIRDELERLLQGRSWPDRNSERELYILLKRFHPADKLTLQQIADQLGVSRERVRQLQKQCKQALQRRVSVESATLKNPVCLAACEGHGR